MKILSFTQKSFVSLLTLSIFMGSTECVYSGPGKIDKEKKNVDKKRSLNLLRDDNPSTPKVSVRKPKKAENKPTSVIVLSPSDTIIKSNSRPSLNELLEIPFEKLFDVTEKSVKIKQIFEEITGDDFEDAISSARSGTPKAIGLIGHICFLLSEAKRFELPYSLNLFEDKETHAITFRLLLTAFQLEDFTYTFELGMCHLLGIGVESNVAKALKYFKHPAHTKDEDCISRDSSDPEEVFKVRLIAIGTGRLKYLEGDENTNKDTRKLIEKYVSDNNKIAECLLAHCLLTGQGFKKNVKRGMALLENLANKQSEPLAHWLIARAYLNGISVKPDLDLGLQRAFQAAKEKVPEALLFLNSSFSSAQKEFQGEVTFRDTITELQKTCILKTFQDPAFQESSKYKVVIDLENAISSVLNSLSSLGPGFMITCFNPSQWIVQQIRNLKESSFVYYHNGCLTWGEANVTAAREFVTFMKDLDALLEKADTALKALIVILEQKIKNFSEMKEGTTKEEKADFKKKKEVYIPSYTRKIGRLKADLLKLPIIKKQFEELLPSTERDRCERFLTRFPFLNIIDEGHWAHSE